MKTLDNFAGMHITAACEEAVEHANANNESVRLMFNDTEVIAQPGDSTEALVAKWQADFDAAAKAYRELPEYKERQEREVAEMQRKMSAVMKESAQTEAEMREAKEPWPYTEQQLLEYIASLVDRQHDYGTCVYSMSLAASAAFNYVAHKLGVTGFQSSCADLDFIRRTRGMKGPFILLKAEDMLYPQYNLQEKLAEAIEGWKPWAKEQAAQKLQETGQAHPNVTAHWKKLSRG